MADGGGSPCRLRSGLVTTLPDCGPVARRTKDAPQAGRLSRSFAKHSIPSVGCSACRASGLGVFLLWAFGVSGRLLGWFLCETVLVSRGGPSCGNDAICSRH